MFVRSARFTIVLCLAIQCAHATGAAHDLLGDAWTAVDALGRPLPNAAQCSPPRPGRQVGIFYFLWLGAHGYDASSNPDGASDPLEGVVAKAKIRYESPYDISKILAANPANCRWGPPSAFHYWGQPYLGYYLSDDDFVIRKHCQMLQDAGVDVLILDATNAFTYAKTYLKLCRIFREIRAAGSHTPQIAFIVNSRHIYTVDKLYNQFYAKKLYPELWFRWKGKPLLLSPMEGLDKKYFDFFTIRYSWAWSREPWFGDGRDRWPWVDFYPQRYGWHDDAAKAEALSVSPASHPFGICVGRSYHDGRQPPPGRLRTAEGLCFAEQARRALEIDPEFLFVTGWNEWVAQRFVASEEIRFLGRKMPAGTTYFIDNYNQEFSRDIEPMRGGHGDNYYCQMASLIRRFKGVRPQPAASAPKTIAIDGKFEDWDGVLPEYSDDRGDVVHRNHPGWGAAGPYVNTSGRNDLVSMKVARDADNLYFYARTARPISPRTDPNWMMLFIKTGRPGAGNWEGYQYVLNRQAPSAATQALLERGRGGWSWEPLGPVAYAVSANQLELAIPRKALGLAQGSELSLEFKWVDNMQRPGQIMDWLENGDIAPNGRFTFRYQAREP